MIQLNDEGCDRNYVDYPIQQTWGDLQSCREGGKCTVFGKGDKTRVVLIPARVWQLLMKLPRLIDAVFVSRTGRPLERTMVFRIVKDCAKRSGVSEKASCHWLRHSHASHAIESGCNLRLLQQSLGHSRGSTEIRVKSCHISLKPLYINGFRIRLSLSLSMSDK